MSLVDYSEMKDEINNAPEPKVLKAGTEVKVRIVKINTGISEKNDCGWKSIVFDVPADPMVKEFNDFFWNLDRDKLDSKSYERTKYQYRIFGAAFGIDYARPIDFEEELPGKEGWVIVGTKKSDEYGEQNNVKKYLAKK